MQKLHLHGITFNMAPTLYRVRNWAEIKKDQNLHSPAVTVWRTDIGPDTNQKVYHIVVAPADGIVKGSDAFVIGLAGVAHLSKNILHSAFIIV